jgi:hypothetical protein
MAELKFVFGSKKNPVLISLGEFEGRPRVDIRKYFPSKEDPEELLPTRKGISLNHGQLEELIEIINSKRDIIDDFFSGNTKDEKNSIFLVERPIVGRSFNVTFNNGETIITLAEDISKLKNISVQELLPKLIEAFYRSALDTIEDSDDFERLMNRLNFLLKRI